MFERRAVLAGLAGLPLVAAPAIALSAVSGFMPADPFTTYHQRIVDLHAAIDTGLGDEAADPLMDAWGAIDREALAGQPVTLAGAAGALEMARREFVQFKIFEQEGTADPSNRLILHLLDGALGVLRQAAAGGMS